MLCLLPVNDHAEQIEERQNRIVQREPIQTRSRTRNMMSTGMKCLMIMLVAANMVGTTEGAENFNITKFENQPGLYFEDNEISNIITDD